MAVYDTCVHNSTAATSGEAIISAACLGSDIRITKQSQDVVSCSAKPIPDVLWVWIFKNDSTLVIAWRAFQKPL